jgi:hypothetical protein
VARKSYRHFGAGSDDGAKHSFVFAELRRRWHPLIDLLYRIVLKCWTSRIDCPDKTVEESIHRNNAVRIIVQ